MKILYLILAFVAGALVTFGAGYYSVAMILVSADDQLLGANAATKKAHEEIEALQEQLAKLSREHEMYRDQATALEAQLEEHNDQGQHSEVAQIKETATPTTEPIDNFWSEMSQALEEDAPESNNKNEKHEERAEREEGFRQRMQERMSGMFEEMIAESPPERQERLAALRDYTSYMFDLRRQIEAAPEGAEKDALKAELDQVETDLRQLVRDEQHQVLSQVAQEHGITDQEAINDFVTDMRQTLRDPFFSPFATGPQRNRRGWDGRGEGRGEGRTRSTGQQPQTGE